MTFLRRVLVGTWLPFSILIAWQLLEPSVFFPRPSSIIERLISEFGSTWLEQNVYPTIRVFMTGYISGIFAGFILGFFAGYWSRIYLGLVPVMVFFRKMPSVAKFPIVMAIIGIGVFSQIFAVALSVALMLALVVAKTIHDPPQNVSDLGRLFKLSRHQKISLLFIPSRFGEIWTVAKSAIQVALLVTIFSETIGSGQGIGALTIRAKSLFDIELMWVGMLVVGLLSFLIHQFFEAIERALVSNFIESKSV